MKCDSCSAELKDGAKFCTQCGAVVKAPSPSSLAPGDAKAAKPKNATTKQPAKAQNSTKRAPKPSAKTAAATAKSKEPPDTEATEAGGSPVVEGPSTAVVDHPDEITTSDDGSPSRGPELTCQECGFVLDADLKFCTSCGTQVPVPTPPPAVAASLSCEHCGSALQADDGFCTRCGRPVVAQRAPLANPELVGSSAGIGRISSGWVIGGLGLLVFVIIIIAVASSGSSSNTAPVGDTSPIPVTQAPDTTPTSNFNPSTPLSSPATSVTAPTSGIGTNSYATTDGVIIRSGPGTSNAQVGSIASGVSVVVECTTQGESINGPYGPDSHWDRVTYNGTTGYVTDEFLDTKSDIDNPNAIPVCP